MRISAFLGLGSNLGDRDQNLAQAVQRLADDGVAPLRVSSVYESAPVGPVRDQPAFLNAVIEVKAEGNAMALLRRCLDVETQMGRCRTLDKGPRLIDLDVLLVGGLIHRDAILTVPHPGLTRRAFVLVPLLELEPDLVDPRDGCPLAARLAEVRSAQPVVRQGVLQQRA